MYLVNRPLRRGFRPTVAYVGSQCASEDWQEQARFHRTCAEIAAAASAAFEAEWRD